MVTCSHHSRDSCSCIKNELVNVSHVQFMVQLLFMNNSLVPSVVVQVGITVVAARIGMSRALNIIKVQLDLIMSLP